MYCNNTIQVVTKLGAKVSYLDCFEKDVVNLIYAKKPSLASETEEIVVEDHKNDESIEKCDLTGDPLEVDLGENDSVQIVKVEETANKWSVDESKHFPLPVREARNIAFRTHLFSPFRDIVFIRKVEKVGEEAQVHRSSVNDNSSVAVIAWDFGINEALEHIFFKLKRELNKILKKTKPAANNSLPTYIVCSADDPKKTVLLGANSIELMASSVHVMGTIPPNEVEKLIEEMVDDHLGNCHNGDNQVEYSVKMTYNLYGTSLRNIPCQNMLMRQMATHGTIFVDITSPEKVFRITESGEGHMKMHVEVVAGHTLLRLHFLWKELVQLQELIDILTDSELSACEETIICKDPLDTHIILQSLVELLSLKSLKREREKEVVDLDNLRQDDLLDGLWSVLIRCENISVLRNSLNFLFEELAEGSIRILPIKDDCSKISTIIRGILQGKIALSAMSLVETIELLFELGAQKLKFYFQAIFGQFDSQTKTTIDTVWRALYQKDQQDTKKSRRTRMTRMSNHIGAQNLSFKDNLLAYLSQLYVGSEFIYLVKDQVNLNDEGFRHFIRCVEKEYVSHCNSIIDFNIIYQSPLNELSFDLDLKNISIVEGLFPSRWTMSMKSGGESTIYDLSDSPIFPPVIFDYDVPVADAGNFSYFVSKMNRSSGLF